MGRATSAIPLPYYLTFGVYEPLVTVVGCVGTLRDPKATHDSQAPWPRGVPPSAPLSTASLVTIVQLAHVCALVGLMNFFVLRTVRSTLSAPHLLPLQEKIVRSLLIPLVAGDVFHIGITLWALEPAQRWDVSGWSPLLTTTIVMGLSLLVPRVMWHAGIGRYVDSRDGPSVRENDGVHEQKQI